MTNPSSAMARAANVDDYMDYDEENGPDASNAGPAADKGIDTPKP